MVLSGRLIIFVLRLNTQCTFVHRVQHSRRRPTTNLAARRQRSPGLLFPTTTSSTMANTPGSDQHQNSLISRSWHLMSDVLSPFSPSALAQLPRKTFSSRPRYTRADNVPETIHDEHGQMPTVRDYHAINSVPPQVRVPKKIATPIKVEGKVWFANERSECYYMRICMFYLV